MPRRRTHGRYLFVLNVRGAFICTAGRSSTSCQRTLDLASSYVSHLASSRCAKSRRTGLPGKAFFADRGESPGHDQRFEFRRRAHDWLESSVSRSVSRRARPPTRDRFRPTVPGSARCLSKAGSARSRRIDRPLWPRRRDACSLAKLYQDRQHEQDHGLLLDQREPVLPPRQFPGDERNLILDAVQCLERLADLSEPVREFLRGRAGNDATGKELAPCPAVIGLAAFSSSPLTARGSNRRSSASYSRISAQEGCSKYTPRGSSSRSSKPAKRCRTDRRTISRKPPQNRS